MPCHAMFPSPTWRPMFPRASAQEMPRPASQAPSWRGRDGAASTTAAESVNHGFLEAQSSVPLASSGGRKRSTANIELW